MPTEPFQLCICIEDKKKSHAEYRIHLRLSTNESIVFIWTISIRQLWITYWPIMKSIKFEAIRVQKLEVKMGSFHSMWENKCRCREAHLPEWHCLGILARELQGVERLGREADTRTFKSSSKTVDQLKTSTIIVEGGNVVLKMASELSTFFVNWLPDPIFSMVRKNSQHYAIVQVLSDELRVRLSFDYVKE